MIWVSLCETKPKELKESIFSEKKTMDFYRSARFGDEPHRLLRAGPTGKTSETLCENILMEISSPSILYDGCR